MLIYLTAIIKSKAGRERELKSLLQDLVFHSKQEEACIQYDLHQGTDNPLVFVFHEIWYSAEALATHNKQPYIKRFTEIAPPLIDGTVEIHKTELLLQP